MREYRKEEIGVKKKIGGISWTKSRGGIIKNIKKIYKKKLGGIS